MDREITIRLKDGKLSPNELEELCTLGYNLENGILCEEDKSKALELYKLAYDQGSMKGANNFGYLLSVLGTSRESTVIAISILERSANSGNTVSMVNLGNIYEYGQLDGKPDYKNALKWYHRAALMGDNTGLFDYANMLHNGYGKRRDRETALAIFRKLTERGFKAAPFYVGLYYEKGYVVEKDYATALRFYQLGASANDPYCYNQLGRMYSLGLGLPKKEESMGFFYYEQAAKLGDIMGVSNMAYAYEVGQGVEQDIIKAIELYQQAADAGEENAIKSLKRIQDELLPKQKESAETTAKTSSKKNSKEN